MKLLTLDWQLYCPVNVRRLLKKVQKKTIEAQLQSLAIFFLLFCPIVSVGLNQWVYK